MNIFEAPIEIFRTITTIPRTSGDEKRIGEYLLAFAKERGLDAEMDSVYNVVIRKPGTKGYEASPTLVLQSHTDMVYIKSESSVHDYNNPLNIVEKDGFLSASGTSLGADNGIGMAYILALLDSTDVPHPPLEGLFTTGEETGMEGVTNLSPTLLKGRRMINLDSEWEGAFTVGCAGGNMPTFTRKASWEAAPNCKSFKITISGLQGGHSGVEIHKGRGNAIRLLGRVLFAANTKLSARIGTLSGGSKMNAIPDRAEAVLFVEDECALEALIEEYNAAFKYELSGSDKGVSLTMQACDFDGKVLDERVLQDVLALILNIPVNVQTMNMHLTDLVESSNNIGVLACTDDAVSIACAIRSSVVTLKSFMNDQMILLAKTTNSEVCIENDYPEWAFAVNSPLRDKAIEIYEKKYGKQPEVISIHAGLECGFFKAVYPDMDMISTGPNLYDVHTPMERLDIVSAKRVYEWLVELVAALIE